MKYFILIAIVLLSGCGKLEQLNAHWTGQPAEVCVRGVTYLQFTSGAALSVDINGKPTSCK